MNAEIGAIDRIILIGFMGSGKSTVGRLLAQRLQWTFYDLDAAVEERCQQSVPRIFAEHGEQHFREQEASTLQLLVPRLQVVIALGGGATEHTASQALLRGLQRSAVIYLDAPFPQLQERCLHQATHPGATARPLLADAEAAQKRFASRTPVYQRLATHRVDTSGRTPMEVVERIVQDLR